MNGTLTVAPLQNGEPEMALVEIVLAVTLICTSELVVVTTPHGEG